MLQQTRVEAVKPYYRRFMEELPDVASLARVSQERLLKLWEGLGYYSRARNLQAAALQVMEEYGGRMPGSRRELMGLKGIGSYTAGAIASIAFGKKEPAVDGNVLRVLSRLRMDDGEITDPRVRQRVERELSKRGPGAYEVSVKPNCLSTAQGQRKENLDRLLQAGFRVRLLQDEDVPEKGFVIKQERNL